MAVVPTRTAKRRNGVRNTVDVITERLRAGITSGSYHPNERLVEEDVAERLKTNRATVRMAMARLEHEGLIERERNRGARVRLVSDREAIEILEIRAALEGIVARYAAQNVTANDAARLRRIAKELEAHHAIGDVLSYSHANVELHNAIAEIAGHETSTRLLGLLKSQIVRYQYRSLFQPGRMRHSVLEHRKLIDAIIKKNPVKAEAAMRSHLDNAVIALRRAIKLGSGL